MRIFVPTASELKLAVLFRNYPGTLYAYWFDAAQSFGYGEASNRTGYLVTDLPTDGCVIHGQIVGDTLVGGDWE